MLEPISSRHPFALTANAADKAAGNKSTCCLVAAVRAHRVCVAFIACFQCFVQLTSSPFFFFRAVGAAPSKQKQANAKAKPNKPQTNLSNALCCLQLPTAPLCSPALAAGFEASNLHQSAPNSAKAVSSASSGGAELTEVIGISHSLSPMKRK